MNILLAVTGSISCYKAFDLTRLYVKSGHHVRVVLSKGADSFIKKDLFNYLGAEKVYQASDDFNLDQYEKGNVLHIDLANWASIFVVAPLSANTLAHFCRGEAQDLMQSIFLALPLETPKLFFPAMNTKMLTHPFVQENLAKLAKLPHATVFPTSSGELACGEIGEGKLLDIENIFHLSETCETHRNQPQDRKNVLITTGATVAPLDPVRFLTNASSGKTGFHLAKQALKQGHRVNLVAGIYATKDLEYLVPHPLFTLWRVKTNQEMKEVVSELFDHCDLYISSAAIGDLEFKQSQDKIKKSDLSHSLPIKKASDILQEMITKKKNHQKIVGFAAETNLSVELMQEKMTRKPVDLLVGTKVHSGITTSNKSDKDETVHETQGFAVDKAHYLFMEQNSLTQEKEQEQELSELSKEELAACVFQKLAQQTSSKRA